MMLMITLQPASMMICDDDAAPLFSRLRRRYAAMMMSLFDDTGCQRCHADADADACAPYYLMLMPLLRADITLSHDAAATPSIAAIAD